MHPCSICQNVAKPRARFISAWSSSLRSSSRIPAFARTGAGTQYPGFSRFVQSANYNVGVYWIPARAARGRDDIVILLFDSKENRPLFAALGQGVARSLLFRLPRDR